MVHHYYKQQKYILTFNFATHWHLKTGNVFKLKGHIFRLRFCYEFGANCDQAEFRSVRFSESEG